MLLSINTDIFVAKTIRISILVTNILIKSGKTMRVIIESNYQALSQWAANYVASKINAANPTPEKPFVLGCIKR